MDGQPHRVADGPPHIAALGRGGHEGQRIISPVKYPKSPFLTVLKPQEAGGSFAEKESVCS